MGALARNGLIVCSIRERFSHWILKLTEWVLNVVSKL